MNDYLNRSSNDSVRQGLLNNNYNHEEDEDIYELGEEFGQAANIEQATEIVHEVVTEELGGETLSFNLKTLSSVAFMTMTDLVANFLFMFAISVFFWVVGYGISCLGKWIGTESNKYRDGYMCMFYSCCKVPEKTAEYLGKFLQKFGIHLSAATLIRFLSVLLDGYYEEHGSRKKRFTFSFCMFLLFLFIYVFAEVLQEWVKEKRERKRKEENPEGNSEAGKKREKYYYNLAITFGSIVFIISIVLIVRYNNHIPSLL